MQHRKAGSHLNTCAALFSVLVTTTLSVFLAITFSHVQPKPYMDEIFHVQQTMAYLDRNWTQWDQKITTPPGTYLLFWIFHQFLDWMQLVQNLNTLAEFRCFNSLLCGINHLVLLALVQQLQPDCNSIWTSLAVITNPVLFFFSALYYTDQCALLFTLLMVYFAMKRHATLSALVGAFGIMVRQTNVVWMLVSVCILTGDQLNNVYSSTSPAALMNPVNWFGQLVRQTIRQPVLLFRIVRSAFLGAPIHFLVVASFLLFVRWNGGIVLGDRSAHQAVIHVCQLWYFSVFCALLTPCSAVKFVIDRVHTYRRRPMTDRAILFLLLLPFLIGILLSLRYTSFAHPYLLADNRHYTFYVWRKLIARSPVTFYALSLVYLICSLYWLDRLFGSSPVVFTRWLISVAIVLCTVFSLVPAGLLEPRYFIIPYTLWRLFTIRADALQLNWHRTVEVFTNFVVILVTCYLFCMKPFYWEHEPGVVQRFMW